MTFCRSIQILNLNPNSSALTSNIYFKTISVRQKFCNKSVEQKLVLKNEIMDSKKTDKQIVQKHLTEKKLMPSKKCRLESRNIL